MSAPYQLFDVLPAHIADALRASIERFGVLVPVVRDQHGNTIDGHHRARIADELGVEYRVDVVQVADEDEAREVARHLNSRRRHLTGEQLREHIVMLAQRATPAGIGELSQREIAQVAGVAPSYVNKVLSDPQVFTSEHLPDSRRGADGKVYPARRPESAPAPAPLPTPEPTADAVACEACGTELPDDQAKAGYLRCDECDGEGDHYSENFPNGPGRCVMCHGRPEDQDERETTPPPAIEPEPAPEPQWSDDELALRAELEAGRTVVVSLRAHHANLTRWADAAGLLVRIDRRTDWGNPFEMPADGDRQTVIRNYADHYLPHKPSLLDRIESLTGKALACWCAPDDCHGDVLKEATEQ
ncbi:DUF4326 domain-containing protein [Micromonospora sp. WMMD1102]|uniref:DUF4326 domain-containing protein n=1 Tax=Micromonospora sp. WMMD1102 TaxID=3016105 RepID=UPI0024157559|nr:DUF4326 domain-containing protein [Micromonospora sp. WMMD1102]MDG4784330.1 DUF4326 domain-containing protein [Micromonospora sp. WMMD1102]MDG4784403.1 DUF4326 domain-containing protein [Micromonospora sp. WMMD1102]MDG4791907.1 DUF4326 domain-containing protein [Micromonospora sp. WMMD1102]